MMRTHGPILLALLASACGDPGPSPEYQRSLDESKQRLAAAKEQAQLLREVSAPSEPYSLKMYASLKPGMTHSAVKVVLGSGGTEKSSSSVGGISTIALSWQNDDGSNMILMFQNGRLVSKAQAGLR